eukprot:Skav211651  [mRNA]  locus=scaffold1290:310270:312795:- [translate_table: standard]
MDVSYFGKNGKGKDQKGKGKGKENKGGKKGAKGKGKDQKGKGKGSQSSSVKTCNNCGKPGHFARDCWSAGGGAANPGQQAKTGKGSAEKKGKGKGKGKKNVSSLEEPEKEAEAADTGHIYIAGLEVADDEDMETAAVGDQAEGPSDFVMVADESDCVQVKVEQDDKCIEVCESCFYFPCGATEGEHQGEHICNRCSLDLEQLGKEETVKAVREVVKMMRPEEFEYILDKTICLMKGWDVKTFEAKTEEAKEKLRNQLDPERKIRDANDEQLKEIERQRHELRIEYFERLTQLMLSEGDDRTFGPGQSSGSKDKDPSQVIGQAVIPSRPEGASSGLLMHRTIEQVELVNLDIEKREIAQEMEEAEDEYVIEQFELRLKAIEERKKQLKDAIKESDVRDRAKMRRGARMTKDNLLDQSWHDSRYYQARRAGVNHATAWGQEKKRRKATLFRAEGGKARAVKNIEMNQKWHAAFDSKPVQEDEFQTDVAANIETEAVAETDEGQLRVFKGQAKQLRRGELREEDKKQFVKSARKYRPLTQEEVSKFKVETGDDEKRVMSKGRVNIFKKRRRLMTEAKKGERKLRVRKARLKKKAEEKEKFYLQNPRGEMMCEDFKRAYCNRGAKCKMGHSEVDREMHFIEERRRKNETSMKKLVLKPKQEKKEEEINSFGVTDAFEEENGWLRVVANIDTGAAITAIPSELKEKLGLKADDASERSYKTASGELLHDEGGVTLEGYNDAGGGRKIGGRLVGVHRLLVSGTAVAKRNTVLMSGSSGWIIPKNGRIAKELNKQLERLMKKHADEAKNLTEIYEKKGIFCFDLWCKGTEKELGAMDGDFSRQAKEKL